MKKSLKTNAMLNIIKQICAIIFPLITFPYVSRTLGVEAYGQVNFSASIVSYIALIAGLGVSSYAIREGARIRDDVNAFEKFSNEVFSINVISTVFSYLLLSLLIILWDKLESYKILICILSVNVLLTTFGTDWINSIYEDFLYLTIRYILCQSIAVLATLLFVKTPEDIVMYAILSNLGTMLANVLNIFYIRKKLCVNLKFTFAMNLKKHLRPILLLFGNMISSMIYLYSDTTMLGVLAGDIAVGYYTVASKIYFLIKQLINAVSNVLIPRLSHELNNNYSDKDNTNIDLIMGILTMVLIPIVVGMICMGKEIVLFIAGEEYLAAYSALIILSIALIFSTFACIFVSVIMLAQRMDKEILISSAISAAVNIIFNAYLIPKFSYNAAAFTTLISEFIVLILGLYFTRGVYKINIKKSIFISVIGGLEVFFICNIIKRLIINNLLSLFFSIFMSGLIYFITILIFLFILKKEKKRVL